MSALDPDNPYRHVRFNHDEGSIWLDGERMLLIFTSTYAGLRARLIEALGIDEVRSVLIRLGFREGHRAARLLPPNFGSTALDHNSLIWELQSLSGVSRIETVRVSPGSDAAGFDAEFLLHGSAEADAHLAEFGLSGSPVCWMQVGYVSAYASALVGKAIQFREVECRACGHANCRIVGRYVESLAEESDEVSDVLSVNEFINRLVRVPNSLQNLSDDIVGLSAAFIATSKLVERAAPTAVSVLLQGETGVGKEVFARMLHRLSPRADKEFVAVNCAALPEALVESELFGVVKGAYTGAIEDRMGRFERANHGTLFLDEVNTLSFSSQGKLLRVLQEASIERIGGRRAQPVDVRIIAATNIDLAEAVQRGQFRDDLYYRLAQFPIYIPPLRQRREDIPILVSHFLNKFGNEYKKSISRISQGAVHMLLSYDYPGNIRELENIMRRAVIMAGDGDLIDISGLTMGQTQLNDLFQITSGGELEPHRSPHESTRPVSESADDAAAYLLQAGLSLHEVEQSMVRLALSESGGSVTEAARRLGMSRTQLHYRRKKLS